MKIDRLKDIERRGFRTALNYGIRQGDMFDLNEIEKMLKKSKEGKVNIRTYRDDLLEGNPFVYGLDNMGDVRDEVLYLLGEGYNLIINETIDVNDCGVSGVMLNGVVEFSPFTTPRAVENEGACALPFKIALRIWEMVYNLNEDVRDKLNLLGNLKNTRVEFSIHPTKPYYTIWDIEEVENTPENIKVNINPNNSFSRMLGNKTFGLLLVNALYIMTPMTEVYNRYLPTFKFGSIHSEQKWTRTAPRDKTPGMFVTHKGVGDPINFISEEVPSVLIQDEVKPIWAGSSIYEDGKLIVEGVKGFGNQFMVGMQSPEALPKEVEENVYMMNRFIEKEFESLGILNNGYKLEWGWTDCDSIAVYQFNFVNQVNFNRIIVKGNVSDMIGYETEKGLEGLRELIPKLKESQGIILKGNVGITSHFCDILREWGIPSILESA